jgi:hypothetical protein
VRVGPPPDLEVVVEQGVVYLVPPDGRVARLNRRGSETWLRLADEGGDLDAAASALAVAWERGVDEARASVGRFVEQLTDRGLLVEEPG